MTPERQQGGIGAQVGIVGTTLSRAPVAIAAAILVLSAALPAAGASRNPHGHIKTTSETWKRVDLFLESQARRAGRERTSAVHIEPRTPEGEVYVTHAFGALLGLEPEGDFTIE
jgi:hypothetical protein